MENYKASQLLAALKKKKIDLRGDRLHVIVLKKSSRTGQENMVMK